MKEMKKLTSIFFIIVAGFLISCSSDDSSSGGAGLSIEFKLIGTWELVSVKSNGMELLDSRDCPIEIIFTSNTYQYIESFDFQDGNGCVKVRDELVPPVPYIRNGSTISTSIDGEDYIVQITLLNATTLKLENIYVEDGITYTDVETYTRIN
jgi:hypothetical protein